MKLHFFSSYYPYPSFAFAFPIPCRLHLVIALQGQFRVSAQSFPFNLCNTSICCFISGFTLLPLVSQTVALKSFVIASSILVAMPAGLLAGCCTNDTYPAPTPAAPPGCGCPGVSCQVLLLQQFFPRFSSETHFSFPNPAGPSAPPIKVSWPLLPHLSSETSYTRTLTNTHPISLDTTGRALGPEAPVFFFSSSSLILWLSHMLCCACHINFFSRLSTVRCRRDH